MATSYLGRAPTAVRTAMLSAAQLGVLLYSALALNPAPTRDVRFPKDAVELRDAMDAWAHAVMSGQATEDDSEGHTLTNDSTTRLAELAIRDYALQHEDLALQVVGRMSGIDATTLERLVGAGQSAEILGRFDG